MAKLNLALLSGGHSNEREVSLEGGDQVYSALDPEKYSITRYDPKTDLGRLVADAGRIDMALIILHGAFGEDGTIQGMLDLLDIPYQGSGVLGSALAIDKAIAKQLYGQHGLPVPDDLVITRQDPFDPEDCIRRLGVPAIVKPVTGGSSVGISIVRDASQFSAALDCAFAHDDRVMVESYVDGIELTGGVIGNDRLQLLPVVEIVPAEEREFFDYKAKYTPGITQEICPARIDDAIAQQVQTYAEIAHRALYCQGYSRTDMILEGRDIYVIETNTIPGMTPLSLLPLAAKTAGMSFSELLDRLIELGLEQYRSRKGSVNP